MGENAVKKTLLYRLFKIGRIPSRLRAALESEGFVVVDEGIPGAVLTRDFKAPGKRFRRRRAGFTGFLALTRKRMVGYAYGRRLLHVPFDSPRLRDLDVKLIGPDRLEIAFEASDFQDRMSGRVRLRFTTPRAGEFLEALAASRGIAGVEPHA